MATREQAEPGILRTYALTSQAIISIILILSFALWIAFLGRELFHQVDARLKFNLAALPSVGILVTNFTAAALAPALWVCAFYLREGARTDSDSGLAGFSLNLLGVILGGCIGWGLGVFLVPFDEADGVIYSRIGAGVTAFLSGFVVSYIHPLVQSQLSSRPQAFLVQVGLGVAALLITGLSVTTNRTEYLEFVRLQRGPEEEIAARQQLEISAIKAKYAKEYMELKNTRLGRQIENSGKALLLLDSKK